MLHTHHSQQLIAQRGERLAQLIQSEAWAKMNMRVGQELVARAIQCSDAKQRNATQCNA